MFPGDCSRRCSLLKICVRSLLIPTRTAHIFISESSQAIPLVDAHSHSASLTVPHLFPFLASLLKPNPQCNFIKGCIGFSQNTDGLMPYSLPFCDVQLCLEYFFQVLPKYWLHSCCSNKKAKFIIFFFLYWNWIIHGAGEEATRYGSMGTA